MEQARLWESLQAFGVTGVPGSNMQCVPYIADRVMQKRAYLTESLYTGLTTPHADILLRAYVQAHGYCESLAATGNEPGAYLRDKLLELRVRAERRFLRGES